MDAQNLLNAMITFYLDYGRHIDDHVYDNGQWDLLVHMVTVVRGVSAGEAAEWLAEECQERVANGAD